MSAKQLIIFVFQAFEHFPAANAIIIVEDDLEIAPDFFKYFFAAYHLLMRDSTLYCVSGWNDNGKQELIDKQATTLLYRSDFFPGLGWMITVNHSIFNAFFYYSRLGLYVVFKIHCVYK